MILLILFIIIMLTPGTAKRDLAPFKHLKLARPYFKLLIYSTLHIYSTRFRKAGHWLLVHITNNKIATPAPDRPLSGENLVFWGPKSFQFDLEINNLVFWGPRSFQFDLEMNNNI